MYVYLYYVFHITFLLLGQIVCEMMEKKNVINSIDDRQFCLEQAGRTNDMNCVRCTPKWDDNDDGHFRLFLLFFFSLLLLLRDYIFVSGEPVSFRARKFMSEVRTQEY